MNNKPYQGKRFAGLIIAITVLVLGFVFGPTENFVSFSTAVTFIYGTFLGGQSATDYAKAKNGG